MAALDQIDLLVAVQKTPQREEFLDFSTSPVNQVRYAFYLRQGDQGPGPAL